MNGKLDASIRDKLTKRGMSIISNIYTGFDSEYYNIDNVTNKLLSVQMTITSSVTLKLPVFNPYSYGDEIDVLTGKTFENIFPNVERINYLSMSTIEKYIRECVESYRILKGFRDYDKSFEKIIKGLKGKEIRYVDKKDFVYFIFDLSKFKE
jgi:hypothetical protein